MGAIIVTGIPGVGKTTVMEAAAKARDLKIAVYGSVMFEVASAKGLVKSRDEIRKLPAETQKAIQKEAAKRIAGMGDVIVDTHCSIKTPTGYLPGLPAWVLTELEPSAIVLVEADPKEILRRRQGDATRKRDEDSLEAITEHQEYNRRFAAAYATLTGATVHTVQNKDGGVEAALAQMLPVLGAISSRPGLAAGAKQNVPVGAR
jgi:adenylate kinase